MLSVVFRITATDLATNVLYSERMAGSMVVRVEDDINDINPTSISRSVCVTGFQAGTKSEDLIIHFQRKRNGGGDIERIIVSKKGTAVITFDDPRVVSTVLQHKQELIKGVFLTVKPYVDTMLCNDDQHFEVFELVSADLCLEFVECVSREQTKALLVDIAEKNGVKWIESTEGFMVSGTFKQVEESRAYLKQSVRHSNGIVVFSDPKTKEASSQDCEDDASALHDEAENQEDVNQNRSATGAENEVIHKYETRNNEKHVDHKPSSTSPEIQSFEIEPKILKVFVKAYKKELEDMETKYNVDIPRKSERSKLCLKPKDRCSADDYAEACNQFISLYQNMYQLIKMQRFSLKSEAKIIKARQSISQAGKMFPISLEVCKDQKHWEMYGEASHIEEALKYLENEGVGINRESENAVDEKRRRKQWKNDEEEMDLDPPEHSRGDKNLGNRLETFIDLPAGKVKVSVYKGDITDERVDVIVNAANGDLQHVGGVAKAILDKGGNAIGKESWEIRRQRGQLKDGDVVVTTPGNLHCKAVVHAVGPVWNDLGSKKSKKILRRACLNSFLETEKLSMTSIALPAIGSGIYGMPKDVCAKVMFNAADEFVRQGDAKKKTITDIRFVNIDDPSVQAFRKEFLSRYGGNEVTERGSGEGSEKTSSTSAEGGTAKASPSRSDRGKNQTGNAPKNSGSKMSSFSSSAASSDDPLSVSGHHLSPAASYSGAVKRNVNEKDGRPPKSDGAKADKKDDDCPICLDTVTNPQALKCKHVFCSVCLEAALAVNNMCPVCKEPQGALRGDQPRGDMTSYRDPRSVPGYEGCGTIIIQYHFPSGVQGREHPNPGQHYGGTSRTAYLPDTHEGRQVLQLLRRAFDARLVFTVGTSNTTGRPNQVIWNDIHHKTSLTGGPFQFGYPDPEYLRRVKEELAAKGIK